MTDHRVVHARDVHATGEGKFTARVLNYGVVDEYETIFDAGCFAGSLARRWPVFAWGHDWKDPIGRATRVVRDDKTALDLEFRIDVDPDVPRGRQAYAQLKSGTIDEFSVGFRPRESYTDSAGVKHFRVADLDEVSAVLAGAVPGTELLSVRARSRVDAAQARIRRRTVLTDRERREATAQHERWLKGEWLAGRLTRAQYQDDLRTSREADEVLARLGLG